MISGSILKMLPRLSCVAVLTTLLLGATRAVCGLRETPSQALSPQLAGGLDGNWGIWRFPSAAQRGNYIGSGNDVMAEVCVPQETNIQAAAEGIGEILRL